MDPITRSLSAQESKIVLALLQLPLPEELHRFPLRYTIIMYIKEG